MEYLLRSIFAFMISFTIIAPLSVILNYGIPVNKVFSVLLLVHIIINLVLFNTKILKWFFITLISLAAIFFLILFLIEGRVLIPSKIERYFTDLYNAVVYSRYISSYMFIPTLYLISVGISLSVYILIQNLKKYLLLFVIVFGFFASLIIGGFQIKFIYFFMFLFTYVMMYFEQYFSLKIKDKNKKYSFGSLIPAFLIFAAILTVLPSLTTSLKTDPVSFVDVIIDKVKSIRLGAKSLGDEAVLSYQTDTAFSQGSSAFDSTIIMTVDSPMPFHLRSQTYDYYDGVNWLISDEIVRNRSNVSSNALLPTFEVVENVIGYYTLKNNDPINIQELTQDDFFDIAADLFETIELTITYKNIRTKAIFTPSNTFSIDHDETKSISIDTYSGIFSSENTLRKDFGYTVKTLIPKQRSEEFESLLRKQENNINGLIPNPNLDTYLQVPDSVPDRVRELAISITEQYDNDYDKARAIERYLSSNYTYSLDVENTPDGFDFVDYFLFENNTGYCTYYASSMTIMLRTIGIPARYARGYVMPTKSSFRDRLDDVESFLGIDKLGNSSIYTIYEKYSHAWPEVYLSGYGWMGFEPTSAYYSSFQPEYTQEPLDDPNEPVSNNTDPIDKTTDDDITKPSIVLPLLLMILIVLVISLPFINRLYSKIRYSRLNNQNKIIQTFIKITKLLNLIDIEIFPFETARMYSKKIDQTLLLGDSRFEKIVGVFEKARYSQKDINTIDLEKIENYYSLLREEILSSANKLKMIGYYISNKI